MNYRPGTGIRRPVPESCRSRLPVRMDSVPVPATTQANPLFLIVFVPSASLEGKGCYELLRVVVALPRGTNAPPERSRPLPMSQG